MHVQGPLQPEQVHKQYRIHVQGPLQLKHEHKQYRMHVQGLLQPKHVQILYNTKYRLQVQLYVVNMLLEKMFNCTSFICYTEYIQVQFHIALTIQNTCTVTFFL